MVLKQEQVDYNRRINKQIQEEKEMAEKAEEMKKLTRDDRQKYAESLIKTLKSWKIKKEEVRPILSRAYHSIDKYDSE
jgi:beta-lactamase regulating signal transducer with metallopeptidase domain